LGNQTGDLSHCSGVMISSIAPTRMLTTSAYAA
jgi:hypothetical protein